MAHSLASKTRLHRRRPGIVDFLALAWRTRRERNALCDLDPRLLDDIGVTQADARREAQRTFWDVPGHWLR
ncbi:MAG: DUF1127 domain-containing protein [Pseudomonadota bacterium]